MTNRDYYLYSASWSGEIKFALLSFTKWLRENYYINSSSYFESGVKHNWVKQGDSKSIYINEEELFNLWCEEEYKE